MFELDNCLILANSQILELLNEFNLEPTNTINEKAVLLFSNFLDKLNHFLKTTYSGGRCKLQQLVEFNECVDTFKSCIPRFTTYLKNIYNLDVCITCGFSNGFNAFCTVYTINERIFKSNELVESIV